MAWLAVVAVIGSAALAGIAVGAACRMDDLENGNCRARINRMADESRKGPSRTDTIRMKNRRCYQWIGVGS